MSVHRVNHGLIYDDEFEILNTDRWRTITPSNAVWSIQGEGQLELAPSSNGRSTNVMMDLPQDEPELMFQVYADYYPELDGEGGGIVIWKNAMEKVEFIETKDSTTESTYAVWRAVKRNNLWAFYAQQEDGSWELFDSTICINPVMMGFVLRDYVGEGKAKSLKVNKAVLCRGTHIKVANVSNGDKIELVNLEGEVVREAVVPLNHSGVAIDLPIIPFNGIIRILQKEEDDWKVVSVLEESTEMYGGDLYLKGTDLKVKWRDKWLSEVDPTLVGSLKNGRLDLLMYLSNENEYDVSENTTIKIAQYEDHFGWKWADVALDLNGIPGDYSEEIEMGTLPPLTNKPFWVSVAVGDKTDKEYLAQIMKPTNFYLEVVNK